MPGRVHRQLGYRREAVLGVLLVGLAALVICAKVSSVRGLRQLVRTRLEPHGGKELVVLVHGYTLGSESMRDVADAVHQAQPGADLLFVDYPSQTFSNADPALIAPAVCDAVGDAFEKATYRSVTLVGHSVGALLVRRAFVDGCGQADRMETGAATRAPRPWARHVDRIVLLAGMNRGWSVDPPPAEMSLWKRAGIWAGRQFGRLTGTGRLILSVEKGRPFVADLRVDWMRARDTKLLHGAYPRVIQFLGDHDDVVSSGDNTDVAVSGDFTFVPLHDTGHASVLDLREPELGAARAEKIKLAFSDDPETLRRLRSLWAEPVAPPDPEKAEVKHVIFVMSGIRDLGHWRARLEGPLQKAFFAAHPGEAPPKVIYPGYGYFGMGPFLLFGDRQRNVRWFMDAYTQAIADYPNADPARGGTIDFIGHSNGTYLLGSALEQYRSLRVNRVVLGGSVLPQSYDWQGKHASGQVAALKNYVGSADWVVAWFPRMFERGGDIGSAGFNGFSTVLAGGHQVTYVPGGHAAAFDPRNEKSIVEFVARGNEDPGNFGFLAKERSGVVEFGEKVYPLVWATIAAVVVAVGFAVSWLAARLSRRPRWVWWAAYVVVLVYLLNNV